MRRGDEGGDAAEDGGLGDHGAGVPVVTIANDEARYWPRSARLLCGAVAHAERTAGISAVCLITECRMRGEALSARSI